MSQVTSKQFEDNILGYLCEYNSLLKLGNNNTLNLFSNKGVSQEINTNENELMLLQNGIIIPFDISENLEKLISKDSVPNGKFLSFPDLIYVYVTDNYLDVMPLDIKLSCGIIDDSSMGQISAFNLARLIRENDLLKKTIYSIKEEQPQKKIKLHSGYFLVNRKVNANKVNVDNFLSDIKKLNIENKLEPETWSDFSVEGKKLKFKKAASMEYYLNIIPFEKFTEQIGYVKNMISRNGFFHSEIIAYGFDSKGNKMYQFEYNPKSYQKTFSPRYIKLINRIYELEKELLKLESEIDVIEKMPQKNILEERIEKQFKEVIEGLKKREERVLFAFNSAELEVQKYEDILNPVDRSSNEFKTEQKMNIYLTAIKKRNELNGVLEKIRAQKIKATEDFNTYKTNLKWYSKEGIVLVENTRQKKLKVLNEQYLKNLELLENFGKIALEDSKDELAYVNKKYKQRTKTDHKNTRKIIKFVSESPFQFANKHQLAPHPKMLFVNLDNSLVYKFSFFNVLYYGKN